jgi:hypothetical protein
LNELQQEKQWENAFQGNVRHTRRGLPWSFFPLRQMAMDSPARPGRLPSCFFLLQEFEFACQMVIPLPAEGVLARQYSPFRLSEKFSLAG